MFVDAILDSLKLLGVVAVFSLIIAIFELKLSNKLSLKGFWAPLVGVGISLLPQCGFSVVATDLYHKRHITLGTLIGVYLATSDEALPVFLSYPEKAFHVLPLLAAKLLLGIFFAYLIDLVFFKRRKAVEHHLSHCKDKYAITLTECEGAELISVDENSDACDCSDCQNSECPHFEHKTDENVSIHAEDHNVERMGILAEYAVKRAKRDRTLDVVKHSVSHTIEIFLYVLVVNVLFGLLIYFVGEEKIYSFLAANKYIAPLLSVIVGAVPNCASSIVISKLYIFGGLGFGAALGGLCMNAGVAFVYLFKDVKHTKSNIAVFLLMFFISVAVSYFASLIFSFGALDI